MPSNWYADYMRQLGFDAEDPYFDNKVDAYKPPVLGESFSDPNEITDYFQSGGEYDRAAGGMTGIAANIKDTAINFGRAVEEGGLRAMAVPLDFFGSIGSGMADEFDAEKEKEYLSTKDPEAKYKTGMESLYTGLLRSQSGAAEALRGAADSVSQARTEGAALPSFGTSLSDPLSQFKDAEGIKENTYAAGRTLADAFVGGIDIATDMGAAAVLGAPIVKALGIGGNAVGSLADDAGKLAKSAAYVKDAMTSAVGVGFGVKSFSDMYESQTQSNSDSRVKAIAIAAPYAALSGALEGIGSLETFGERVLTKHLIGDGVTSWIGRRAAATALGGASEGATEYTQQWAQILAEELPGNSVNDKDPMDAWSRIKERAPEAWQAALGGALFGGAIGGVKGVGRVAAADADAVADKDKKDPNAVVKDLSNGVNTPTETLLSGMGDAIVAPAIASVEVKNVAADLADKFVAATEKREELVADAKFETLDAATLDTAKIQSAPEEKAEEVTNEMVNGVLALSQSKLAQFDNIVLGVQNFIQSMSTGQPIATPEAPDQESSSSLAKMSQQLDPRIVAQGFAKQFEELGVDPEVFANGISNVDMNALRSEFEASLVKQASNNFLPMAEAIEKAREPEPDSVVAQNIEKIKAQAGPQESANTKYQKLVDFVKTVPMITVSDIQKTLGVSLKSARAHAAQLEKDGIIGPRRGNQPRQVLLAQEERAEPAQEILLKRASPSGWNDATSAGQQVAPRDVSPIEAAAAKVLSFINDNKSAERAIIAGGRVNKSSRNALDWLTKPFRLVKSKPINGLQHIDLNLPDVDDTLSNDPATGVRIAKTNSYSNEQGYADAIVKQIRSDTKTSERFHDEVTVPFAQTIASRRTELNSLRTVADGAGKTARIRAAKASIMKEVNTYREALARQNIPPGIARSVHDAGIHILDAYLKFSVPGTDEHKQEILDVLTGEATQYTGTENERKAAEADAEAAPAAKIVSSWLYTHASPELARKIVAKMIGQEYSMEESNEMAEQLAEELADDGLFESLPSEDMFTKRAFLDSIVNQGKSTSSPHGLYTALVTAGEDPAVAMSTVASVHAMSVSLAKEKGASYAAFWDKLADGIISSKETKTGDVMVSGLYQPSNRKNRQEFDGKRVSLFANSTIQLMGKSIANIKNTPSVVMQHEIMHALHASGLLLDILGPDGIRALEDVIDGLLYDLDGNALISREYEETQERLAIVWEIFLATQKAPNAELQPAFDAAKNFFRTWLNYFLKMFETTFDVKLWEIERVGQGKAPFRLSYGNHDTYSAQSKKLLENKDAIAALYRLINAQPETEAHMATGGLTMATGALVTEMSEIVGMDMSGAMDAEPMNGDVLSRASDQWSPESGTEPTDDQMADMLGYSGMNTEDQGVKDALKHHKATTGVRLKVWALPTQKQFVAEDFGSLEGGSPSFRDAKVGVEHGPFLRKGGWGPKEDKKKQKMALKIMEKAGSLRGSLDAAAWLQSVYDGWTAGRNNPAFNNEEIETNAVGVGTLMTEYARLWRKFIDEPHLNETMAAINKTLPYIGSASRRAIVDIWTGMTKNLVDVLDPIEKAVQDIGLPAVKHHINNMHSLTTWASKITERVPQYFDRTVGKLGDWVKILGSESWRSIDNDFLRWADAYYAKNEKQLPDKTSRRFRIKAARDLKLWMLAQREIEIFENANKLVEKYLADKKAYDEANGPGSKSPAEVGKMIAANDKGPQPPKVPQISKAALALARNVVTVMKMTYGEDIHALDMISMRFSKWETDSKLVPLLKANMITAKQYADIRTSGLRHVPLHRIKELVDATGALNPKIDGSMYEVLDYLKRDLSFKVEDPLAAAIASVQAINMLVQRQVAKNALGEAVRDNVPIGTKHGEFVMLHSKKKISKEAYDNLPDEKRYSEKHMKHDPNGESGNAMVEEYYEIVPATKDDIDDILKKLRDKMHGIKDKKKLKEAQITMNGAVFAAYLEPGVPTYFRITDATVAESFYMMNNPQALYSQNAYVKALAATQRWFKGQYVTSPQFIYNMLARDIPNAIIRSKHGLRTSDVVRGIVASLDMAGFEQVNDYLDKKGKGQEISDDAIQGFGPFGGLVASASSGGKMDMDLLMAASHDGLNSKNASILKQLWTSYTGNLKLHGVAFPTMEDVSEAFKKGDWGVAGDVVTLVPKMVFSIPRAIMSVPGNILEQAPRLAERRLMMDVNVTRDFPMLLEKFPERYQLDGNGQVLAGYAGRLHRKRWEAAAKRLKADPNAVVAKEDLPIQYGAMEKDYDTRQVTLPFDQKGKWTPVIDLGHIFFGPAMLDMYTNITQIGNNSVTQGIADLMRRKEEIIERKKKLNYNVADILGKEIKYTDQDGRALAMFIKAIAVITIPAIAQAFIYRDDDEWQAQSFAEKLSYYHIPSPWGGRFRIARGLGIMQLMFSDLPTAIMLEFSDKDPKAFGKWGKRFFQSTPLGAVMAGPVAFASGMGGADAAKVALGEVTPEIFKGTSEAVFTDYDTYRDKQVSYETGFAPEDPTRVKADRFNILANLVARIENVQPAQAQHQIESSFPGTKKLIPALANKALELVYGATDTGLPPEVQPSNAPIYGQATGAPIRFYSRSPFGVGNEYVQSIYKLNRILTGYENTAEKLPETSKMLYKAQHPELEHLKIIQDAADRIKSHNEKIIQLRKDGLSKGDNAQTEYDLNKLMTVEAMETYRLFYGKLMGD